GGLDPGSMLRPWANPHDTPGVGNVLPVLADHGHAVTSALLFGSLVPGSPAPRPYALVDHYRILDDKSEGDPYELFDALRRVEGALRNHRYEFINLSLGPALPVEDDEVHAWTALLDEYLSDGMTLATIAVGNNGKQDRASGEARIQVPADCVNGLSVGASDSIKAGWKRAEYSAFGPGRSPGRVKPDIVSFGGTPREPFVVYDPDDAPKLAIGSGTSYASPASIRLGGGLRAIFGMRLGPLALKALLVHSAEAAGHDRDEVGWGSIPNELDSFVVCEDGMVRVVYQGELSPSQYLRA